MGTVGPNSVGIARAAVGERVYAPSLASSAGRGGCAWSVAVDVICVFDVSPAPPVTVTIFRVPLKYFTSSVSRVVFIVHDSGLHIESRQSTVD